METIKKKYYFDNLIEDNDIVHQELEETDEILELT